MKHIFLILSLAFVLSVRAQSSAPVTDTANYLVHEIVGKKSQYIGKPFSILLDSLKISPARLLFDAPRADSLKGRYGFLKFNYATEFEDTHYLIIEWQNPLPWKTYAPKMKEGFLALKNLYAPIIIKDIDVKDYSREDPVKHVIY